MEHRQSEQLLSRRVLPAAPNALHIRVEDPLAIPLPQRIQILHQAARASIAAAHPEPASKTSAPKSIQERRQQVLRLWPHEVNPAHQKPALPLKHMVNTLCICHVSLLQLAFYFTSATRATCLLLHSCVWAYKKTGSSSSSNCTNTRSNYSRHLRQTLLRCDYLERWQPFVAKIKLVSFGPGQAKPSVSLRPKVFSEPIN